MANPPKAKGTRNEGDHLIKYVQPIWPQAERQGTMPYVDYRPTGDWHVQSKKRKTWNIKDVIYLLSQKFGEGKWVTIYSDGDKRRKGSVQVDVAILPAAQWRDLVLELHQLRSDQS